MYSFPFLLSLDRFSFYAGQYPVLIIGAHTACDIYEKRVQDHGCDFAVEPLLDELGKGKEFFILKNQLIRDIIDMNRPSARNNDDLDENDSFFRQMIRFIISVIQKQFKKKPFVLDLHSFDKKDEWEKYDLVLLIQTKEGRKTRPDLIQFSQEFFKTKKWDVGSTDKHNVDDIVEEIAFRDLGIPILIEINERILENKIKLKQLTKDLREYLLACDKRNLFFITRASDAIELNLHELSRRSIKVDYILEQIKSRQIRLNPLIMQAYTDYANILRRYKGSIKESKLDSFEISENYIELRTNASDLSNAGSNDAILFKHILFVLLQQYNTIIIPIELLIIYLKSIYAHINRTNLEEWGMNINSVLQGINYNLFIGKEDRKHMIISIPEFLSDPNPQKTIFKSYPSIHEHFINFIIFIPDNYNKLLSKGDLNKDLMLLKDQFKIAINLEQISEDINNVHLIQFP